MKQWYERWIGYRVFILVPILFYFLGYYFFDDFIKLGDLKFEIPREDIVAYHEIKHKEFAHRNSVATTFFLQLVIGIGVITYIGQQLIISAKHYYSHVQILFFPAIIIFGVLFHTLMLDEGIFLIRALGIDFFKNTLEQITEPEYIHVFCQKEKISLFPSNFALNAYAATSCMIDWTNVFATIIGIGTCTILCLSVDKLSTYNSDIVKTTRFDRKLVTLVADTLSQSIRTLMFLGIFFIFGLAFLADWLIWPEVFLDPDSNYSRDYKAIVNSLLFFNGALYSVIIAAIFLPPYLKMKNYAIRLAEKSIDESYKGSLEAWMQQYGLKFSLGENIRIFLSITGPLITASLSGFFS